MNRAAINMVSDDVRSLRLGEEKLEPPHVGSYHDKDHA